VAISSDGGQTFSTNVAVSAGPSDATDINLNKSGAAIQYGDYTGLDFAHGLLYPSWADNSAELADNPSRPQFEAAAARIAIAHVGVPPAPDSTRPRTTGATKPNPRMARSSSPAGSSSSAARTPTRKRDRTRSPSRLPSRAPPRKRAAPRWWSPTTSTSRMAL
jgi:hypothetical protein